MKKVYELPEEILEELESCACGCGIHTGGGGGSVS